MHEGEVVGMVQCREKAMPLQKRSEQVIKKVKHLQNECECRDQWQKKE